MASKLASLTARVEPAVLRVLLGLPTGLQRRLAGRPVVVDGQRLDPETQLLLRIQRLAREPAAESLPIGEGRTALLRQARLVGGTQPVGEVTDLEVKGADGPLAARLYVPREQLSAGGVGAVGSPLLFFVHGGGWIYCDLDTHDAVCRFLAERAGVRVLSVDYRLAPEHPFPAAVDDCIAAYTWVLENAESLGVDPDRIAVGGDSAGGTLSTVTAVYAARSGLPCRFQLLVYPATNVAEPSRSRELFGAGFFLTSEFIDLAQASYLAGGEDLRDPRISPLFTDPMPENLAPAFIATAGFDPLRDEGEAYARKLADAGVAVVLKRYPGLIHGFLSMVGAGRTSRAAVAEIAAKLKHALR